MKAWTHLSHFGQGLTAFDEVWHRRFHRMFFIGSRYPLRTLISLLSGKRVRPSPEFVRRVRQDLNALLELDIQNVKAGYYPKSVLSVPIFSYLYSAVILGSLDVFRVINRAKKNNWKELPPHAYTGSYPDYYLRTFHWQTDGWFSEKSARRYDASVQFLFGGVADIMRRMALPPISNSISNRKNANILELACGTGSFLPQIQAAFPDASLYGLDLSPDYIRYACKHTKGHNIHLINENVENMSFKNETFDAVICNNLFHELPPNVRRTVFGETYRVLKKNAVFSITDSLQLGDDSVFNDSIKYFSKRFHEPFYEQYIADDLKDIFEECGFEAGEAKINLFSKSIHGTKQ